LFDLVPDNNEYPFLSETIDLVTTLFLLSLSALQQYLYLSAVIVFPTEMQAREDKKKGKTLL
jgi:hypothetical protein